MKRLGLFVPVMVLLVGVAWGEMPAPPVAPNIATDTHFHAMVNLLEKDKITVTELRQGDSINSPTGKTTELVIDENTKFLNIRAAEIKDEETKNKILGKGQVIDVTLEVKDGKSRAVKLQAIGG